MSKLENQACYRCIWQRRTHFYSIYILSESDHLIRKKSGSGSLSVLSNPLPQLNHRPTTAHSYCLTCGVFRLHINPTSANTFTPSIALLPLPHIRKVRGMTWLDTWRVLYLKLSQFGHAQKKSACFEFRVIHSAHS